MQRINLYKAELQEKEIMLSAEQLLMVLAMVIGLIFCIYFFHWWQIISLRQEITAANEQQDILLQKLDGSIEELANRGEDKALLAELKALEAKKVWKEQLWASMDQLNIDNLEGFSGFLEALARQIPNNIWLNKIELDKGGSVISLAGQTVDAETIPLYLNNLHQEDKFKGKIFKELSISRSEKQPNYLDFTLQGLGKDAIQ